MGRSVASIGNNVVYFDCMDFQEFAWQDMIDNLAAALQAKYPSLNNVNKWPENEIRTILESNHVCVGISEYCGIGSVSVFVNPTNEGYWPYTTDLAERWLSQCWDGIKAVIKCYVSVLNRQGTFSNGEGVYRRADDNRVVTDKYRED